jgi:hypothetical protein
MKQSNYGERKPHNMNKYIGGALIVFIAFIGIGMLLSGSGNREQSGGSGAAKIASAVLHKSPTCGCCGVYGSYLKKLGYGVEVHETNDLASVKSELGIPQEVESCHTMEVEGYVVEGHVPEEAVEKLLAEQPEIKGIGMAGMPSGSPGMPGRKTSDFIIYEITHEDTQGAVFMIL